jgi:hypothetical protein
MLRLVEDLAFIFQQVVTTSQQHITTAMDETWSRRWRLVFLAFSSPMRPDLTPCDLFLCGYVKDALFVPPLPTHVPELEHRITKQWHLLPGHADWSLGRNGISDHRLPMTREAHVKRQVWLAENFHRFYIEPYLFNQ